MVKDAWACRQSSYSNCLLSPRCSANVVGVLRCFSAIDTACQGRYRVLCAQVHRISHVAPEAIRHMMNGLGPCKPLPGLIASKRGSGMAIVWLNDAAHCVMLCYFACLILSMDQGHDQHGAWLSCVRFTVFAALGPLLQTAVHSDRMELHGCTR